MKTLILILFTVLLSGPGLHAQRRVPVKKDSLLLGCILQQAVYQAEDKEPNVMGEKELKLVMSSLTDTTVRAPIDLTVTTVRHTEDGRYEVVAFHQDYWLWFTGIEKVKAYKNQKFKKGDSLGFLENGKLLELLVYDFETPLDPKKYLQCK